jgi:hypothetical protein
VSFSFIDKSSVVGAFTESEEYMRPLFAPLDEAERLARNKPHPNIPKHMPKVTEGTLSSTIIKQPRRIIQQVPTGNVKFTDDEGLMPVLQVLLDKYIIPNATTGGTVLQKGWESTQKALTYGSQPRKVFYTQHGNYFGADYYLPYVKSIYLENRQLCSGDANIMFERQYFTPSQVKATIKQEEYLAKMAKERGEKYKSSWDLKALADLLDKTVEKAEDQKTPSEKALNIKSGGIEIITAYQVGVGAEFYSFAPGLENKIIRVKVNPDPRGKIPIIYQYHTVDGGSPLGRGAPEHSGAMQNLIDSQLQGFQWVNALINAPPQMKWGDIQSSQIKLQPDAIIDMGKDPNNKIQSMVISPQALQNFTQNFTTLKSILLTGLNGSDTSIGAQSGNPGFSKTDAGVKQQQSILGIDDNYIRKQYETAEGETFETMINIHVAESQGVRELAVDGDDLEKIAAVYPEVADNGGRLNILYDRIKKQAITFEVDASTSAGDDDAQQTEILDGILEKYSANQVLQAKLDEESWEFSVGETFQRIVNKSGVQDPEKVIRKLSDEEKAQKEQEKLEQQMHEQMLQQQLQQQMAAEQNPETTEQPQEENAEEFEQMADDPTGLMKHGFSPDDITRITEMFNQGATTDDVLAALGVV